MWNRKQNGSWVRLIGTFAATSALALGGIAVSDVAVQPAKAHDNKVYAGASCNDGALFQITTRAGGALISGGPLQTYECPVIRDIFGPVPHLATIRVINAVGADDPVCTLNAHMPNGTVVSTVVATAPALGFTELVFPLALFTPFPFGHYEMSCVLGAGDQIISYRMNE